jgi:plasmid maintenance system killer protein
MIPISRWIRYMVYFSICAWFSSFGWADDRAKDRATLRGIKTITVKVRTYESGWSKELNRVGLSESVLQALIEKQLEGAGITVIAEETSGKSEAEAFLIARIAFLDPEPVSKKYQTVEEERFEKIDLKKKYIYTVRLNLRQSAVLRRDATTHVSAITWQTETVRTNRLSFLQDDVKRMVDVFIEAYSSENALNK